MPTFLAKSIEGPGYKCSVRLLEDTEPLELEYQAHQKGKYLLDKVCEQLNLVEKDYFGLRYVDIDKQRHWLDLSKSIGKQVRDIDPVLFSFCVKFYPPNPFQLKEGITRYQIYLQLKRDLLHGRLQCDTNVAALLGAYILQAELGDYDPEEHRGNYASELKLLIKQTLTVEERMMEIHQAELKGHSPEEMENSFLRTACTLDSYGIDPHLVKDQKGNQLYIGANYTGVLTFQGSRKTNHFRWNDVQKMNYEGKMFIIHILYYEKKQTVGFKCPTTAACRHLWRCAIEQMLFFTSPSSTNIGAISGGSFFSFGSKFKYSGRVEREVLEEMEKFLRDEPPVHRVGSLRRKASSVPATPSTPVVSDVGSTYSTGHRSNRFANMGDHISLHYNTDGSTMILERVDEDNYEIRRTNPLPRHRVEDVESNIQETSSDITDNKTANILTAELSEGFRTISESPLAYNSLDPNQASKNHLPEIPPRRARSSTTIRGPTHTPLENVLKKNTASIKKSGLMSSGLYYMQQIQLIVRACLPSILLTLMSLLVLIVVVFETDYDVFTLLRRAPEMIVLRRNYYEPTKEYLTILFKRLYQKFVR